MDSSCHVLTTLAQNGDVRSLIMLSDGNLASVSSATPGEINIWNIIDFSLIKKITYDNSFICLAEISSKIFAGSLNGIIVVYNLDLTIFTQFAAHSDRVYSIIDLKNGHIASSSWDHKIKIWNTITYELITTLNDHTEDVNMLFYSIHHDFFMSSSDDKTIKLWSKSNYIILNTLTGHINLVLMIDELKNGDIVSGSTEGNIKLWTKTSAWTIKNDLVTGVGTKSLTILNDGNIVAGLANGSIMMLNYTNLNLINIFQNDAIYVSSLRGLPNRRFVSGHSSGQIKIWEC